MKERSIVLLGFVALSLAACSQGSKSAKPPPNVVGEASKPGAYLAYEHTVQIRTSSENVSKRMFEARSACEEGRFGACSLLRFNQDDYGYASGSVTVRIVPGGVEPIVKLAGTDGVVGARETRAEDRAEIVADFAHATDLLERQKAKLSEFQTRKDLSASDAVALTSELASIESKLNDLARKQNGEQRRIETNLLTLDFRASKEDSKWGRVWDAFGGVSGQVADGIAQTIEIVAYGLPMLLIAFPVALLWRWLWRKVTAKNR